MFVEANHTAAIYVRVSTEEQASEGQSISAQIETLTQYCRLYNIKLYKTYKDLGLSGKDTKNRPGLIELIQDCQRGLFNMVIVWKISRLTRSLKDLLELIDIFEGHSIVFASYSERFDTSTPVGRMTLQLLGSIAEFERNTIIENVKLGLREYARKGGRTGAVYGYDSQHKSIVVNGFEAKAVRIIFDLYVNFKLSASEIADIINRQGYRTKRGNKFTKESILYILKNPVYIGLNRYRAPDGSFKEVHGGHEAIIDMKTWSKAVSTYSGCCDKTSRYSPKQKSLLSGILLCPKCKGAMNIFYSLSKGKRYRYYKCLKSCISSMQNADKAEGILLNHIINTILDSFIINDIFLILKDIESQNSKAKALNKTRPLNSLSQDEALKYKRLLTNIISSCSNEERRRIVCSIIKGAVIHKNDLVAVEYLFEINK